MTDERIRERAEQSLAEQMIAEHKGTAATKGEVLAWIRANEPTQLILKRMIAFALSERDAEREQCCKDMCFYCRTENDWASALTGDNGTWWHRRRNGESYQACDAAAIRTRVAAQGEK